jgi:hypothetical protein
VSGEWSLLATRYLAFKTAERHWVEWEPQCTAEGCRKQEFGLRNGGNGDVGGMQRVAVQTGGCKLVVPPKASKDDKLPKIKRWDIHGWRGPLSGTYGRGLYFALAPPEDFEMEQACILGWRGWRELPPTLPSTQYVQGVKWGLESTLFGRDAIPPAEAQFLVPTTCRQDFHLPVRMANPVPWKGRQRQGRSGPWIGDGNLGGRDGTSNRGKEPFEPLQFPTSKLQPTPRRRVRTVYKMEVHGSACRLRHRVATTVRTE